MPDGTRITYDVLGCGANGIVLRRNSLEAFKIPKLVDVTTLEGKELDETLYLNRMNVELLAREVTVYERLRGVKGVIDYHGPLEGGILLELGPGGCLEDLVRTSDMPDKQTRKVWIFQMIEALRSCHDRCVLVYDIALRNFVLDANRSLRMIDFAQSTVFGMHEDMVLAEDEGLTAKVDIFHLGCVIYSICTWQKYERNLFDEGLNWPSLEKMPLLEGVMLGKLIGNCWTREYDTLAAVQLDFDKSP